MKLLLKFNLVLLLLFATGLVLAAALADTLLQRQAREEVLDRARLMMEKAMAVRSYTADQIAPLLQTQMKYTFMPQSVPAYSAVEVLSQLSKKYPEYMYREATLNPTNLRDRAVEWESDIVYRFRSDKSLGEFVGERETPSGRSLYVARPIRIDNPACMQCHSTVDVAPRTMLDKYGTANGFGWSLHQVEGAQIVSVPMAIAVQRAHQATVSFLEMLAAVFVGMGLVLNVALTLMVVRPVNRLALSAYQASMGAAPAPETERPRGDEIGDLEQAVSRLHRSMAQAMAMVP